MGDMGDMYRDWKAGKKEKRAKREAANLEKIRQWIEEGEEGDAKHLFVKHFSGNIQFALPGKPKIDFYPTKNKWRKGKVIYYGNAEKFIEWYDKQ